MCLLGMSTVKGLKAMVVSEEQVLFQASNALSQCLKGGSGSGAPFVGSAAAVECHRLLLLASMYTALQYTLCLAKRLYARLQIFIQLSPILMKLCHIKRDYLVHIICSKCLTSAETHAFRRLRKSLIALLIVVCGESL